MADEEKELQQEEPKKKKGFLKWIILAVLLLALAGGGYFAYMKFLAPPADPAEQGAKSEESVEAAEEGLMVTLPVMVVNLADPLGRRYLKIGLEVEVINEDAQMELDKYMPKVKDKLILLLSSKTFDQLSTMQAKMDLKNEIVNRLNQILGKNKVLNVYITEMVVQ